MSKYSKYFVCCFFSKMRKMAEYNSERIGLLTNQLESADREKDLLHAAIRDSRRENEDNLARLTRTESERKATEEKVFKLETKLESRKRKAHIDNFIREIDYTEEKLDSLNAIKDLSSAYNSQEREIFRLRKDLKNAVSRHAQAQANLQAFQ